MSFKPVHDEVISLFGWNPPAVSSRFTDSRPYDGEEMNGVRRLAHFYDEHLAEDLTLQRVVQVKGLPEALAERGRALFEQRTEHGIQENMHWGVFVPEETRRDECRQPPVAERKHMRAALMATDVYHHYAQTSARYCLPLTSTLRFHPDQWINVLAWSSSHRLMNEAAVCAASLRFSNGIDPRHPSDRGILCFVEQNVREAIQATAHRFPDAATWDLHSPDGDGPDAIMAVQRHLDEHQELKLAPSRPSSNIGSPSLQTYSRLDRDWLTDSVGLSSWSRSQDKEPVIGVSSGSGHRLSRGKAMLQAAWAQSVRQKTSFLVITAGTHEFIGIRHRASQTLYLSDMIKPSTRKPPGYAGYGQLQVGLYVAAIEDAMERAQLRNAEDFENGYPRASEDMLTSSEEEDSPEQGPCPHRVRPYQVPHEVLLVTMCYGAYRSVQASVFVRGLHAYQIAQLHPGEPLPYFSVRNSLHLQITSEIASGATGVVHGGCFKIKSTDRQVRQAVVVKFAFGACQKDDLSREYDAYRTLARRGIQGVPLCYGLFNAVDPSGPRCLVLSHEGNTLAERDIDISQNDQQDFERILRSIHGTGILHGDIERTTNMMVDSIGRPVIIDLAYAKLKSTKDERLQELEALCAVLRNHNLTRAALASPSKTICNDNNDQASSFDSDTSDRTLGVAQRTHDTRLDRRRRSTLDVEQQCSLVPPFLRRNSNRAMRRKTYKDGGTGVTGHPEQ